MKKKTAEELYNQLKTAINNKPTKDNPIPAATYSFNIAREKLDYLRNHFLTAYEEAKTDASKEYVKTVFLKRIKKLLSDIENRGVLETRMKTKYIDIFQASIDDIEAYCSNKEDTNEPEAPKETPEQVGAIFDKPKISPKTIFIKGEDTIPKIHSELKSLFPDKEAELLKVLQGEQLGEFLLFHHNQNKFVEVFRRLKYNGYIANKDTEIKNWICDTFQFKKNGDSEPRPFNPKTVWNNLNKGRGEPAKKERLCTFDWLPYKSQENLKKAAQAEQH